ncbi:unnamed protein product [Paramecium pentaurelia]|uniref:Transmembrane protein n=1 Tax=Paramecium pentaurelia TaxID=43138 RepID=A0A8S1UWA3_9CILI|nr:unnamed protein product [Paramecium pentaurelia]
MEVQVQVLYYLKDCRRIIQNKLEWESIYTHLLQMEMFYLNIIILFWHLIFTRVCRCMHSLVNQTIYEICNKTINIKFPNQTIQINLQHKYTCHKLLLQDLIDIYIQISQNFQLIQFFILYFFILYYIFLLSYFIKLEKLFLITKNQ